MVEIEYTEPGMTKLMQVSVQEKVKYAFDSYEKMNDVVNYIGDRLNQEFGGYWIVVMYKLENGGSRTYSKDGTFIRIKYKGCKFVIFQVDV